MLTPEQRAEALKKIAKAAVESERRTGLPAELTAAQCILESGWLEEARGNNCFGIKYVPERHAHSQLWETTEYVNGKPNKTHERFAAFATLTDCFVDHALIITTKPAYAKAWAKYQVDRNISDLIKGVARKYATDPAYAVRVQIISQQNNVTRELERERSS